MHMDVGGSGSGTSLGQCVRVLLIEDDPDDVYLLKQRLKAEKRKQYQIAHRTSLAESMEYLLHVTPDVILLDLGLNDSQGIETVQTLVKFSHEIPIIVLTTISDELLGEKAIQLGADDYIPKQELNTSILSRAIAYTIERSRLRSELTRKANEDGLTGLPNRSAFFDRLDVLIHQGARNNNSIAVALLDLDGFKAVNDTLGHKAGDDLLVQFSSRLRNELRKSDLAARYGGDEFVLILTNYSDHSELMSVLESKLERLTEPFEIRCDGVLYTESVGASIGVAEWEPSLSANKLVSRADSAMYQCKNNGKGGVVRYIDNSAA